MASYQSFAQVYDLFMDNIDYDGWSAYLISLLKEYGVDDGLVFCTLRIAVHHFDLAHVASPCSLNKR